MSRIDHGYDILRADRKIANEWRNDVLGKIVAEDDVPVVDVLAWLALEIRALREAVEQAGL